MNTSIDEELAAEERAAEELDAQKVASAIRMAELRKRKEEERKCAELLESDKTDLPNVEELSDVQTESACTGGGAVASALAACAVACAAAESALVRLKETSREHVLSEYISATKKNEKQYLQRNVKASSEYIFANQKEDARKICKTFYESDVRAVSIVKRTKVGMDGLMIELAKEMCIHEDNEFVLDSENIYFLTGMSNKSWENDMKDKMPGCFKERVFHHGQLQKSKLKDIKNGLIMVDEIDTGDKEGQKLHLILKESGILDMRYMEEKNIRFVFVSATMVKELHELYKWGDKHSTHWMTIPENYIGHKEFLERKIIKEYYPINDAESADRWVEKDILENYGSDYRVHLCRTTEKDSQFIWDACIRKNIIFRNHTQHDRISDEDLCDIFKGEKHQHQVIAVKGFYRRANLIPNEWKMRIGATHERYVKKYDTNVQVQGFPGRMSGYWRECILNGHKTGPYRTSIDAMIEYETWYSDPYGENKYSTNSSTQSFVNPRFIQNLDTEPQIERKTEKRIPVVINVESNDVIFTLSGRKEKVERIKCILRERETEKSKKLLDLINKPCVKCGQITMPKSVSSYKKHITDVVSANLNNKPYSIDLDGKCKDNSNWQLFIDNKENRLCFVIWCIDETLYND